MLQIFKRMLGRDRCKPKPAVVSTLTADLLKCLQNNVDSRQTMASAREMGNASLVRSSNHLRTRSFTSGCPSHSRYDGISRAHTNYCWSVFVSLMSCCATTLRVGIQALRPATRTQSEYFGEVCEAHDRIAEVLVVGGRDGLFDFWHHVARYRRIDCEAHRFL
jgi:hypothetical protein